MQDLFIKYPKKSILTFTRGVFLIDPESSLEPALNLIQG